MGSYTRLTYHIVFGTKCRRPVIGPEEQPRLYEYMGGILRANKGHSIEIGGVRDHVHILAELSPAIALADVLRSLKAGSSKWINEQAKWTQNFQWQKGYSAFTVSYSHRETVRKYIQNQEKHHRKKTFQEEYIDLLKRHNIEFRLDFLFEDEHTG